jgi:ATP synthase I subunit
VSERDPFVHRLERDALAACGCCAVAGLFVGSDGVRVAAGVLGGGLLAAISYRAIKSAVEGTTTAGGRPRALVKFVTRHAILALAAYVMLTRLRLHPVGLLVGVSALVVAAAAAVVRSSRRST